jgi:hypothetical protein
MPFEGDNKSTTFLHFWIPTKVIPQLGNKRARQSLKHIECLRYLTMMRLYGKYCVK